jgi:hypothetical protein
MNSYFLSVKKDGVVTLYLITGNSNWYQSLDKRIGRQIVYRKDISPLVHLTKVVLFVCLI